jgi:hypothetical protein
VGGLREALDAIFDGCTGTVRGDGGVSAPAAQPESYTVFPSHRAYRVVAGILA